MKFIKDPIYGNIVCSKLEFEIFALPVFNRLHNILQNSMAFMVYPSNKTSRFAHSIGVCHIAGELYKYGLQNSKEEVLKDFLIQKENLVNNYFTSELKDRIDGRFGVDADKFKKNIFNENKINFVKLTDCLNDIFGEYFVNGNSIKCLNENELVINILLMQSIRLFGLLHDFGHLPFSHLFEFAIEDFYEDISDDERYKKDIKDKFKILIEENEDEIHEFIGKKLSKLALRYIQNTKLVNSNSKEIFVIFEILIFLLNELYKGKDSKLLCLYELVSSDLDADRLDYVARDLKASGLKDNFDTDRIIKLFVLDKRDDESNDDFRFYPAVQSIYDIDLLFENRNVLYKMILNHHKVKKFDYILQILIKQLFYNELDEQDSKNISINNMTDILNLIVKLYKTDDNLEIGAIDRIFYQFSQVTDYWLLGKLRSKLLEQILGNIEQNELFKNLASELFGGTKKYKSLYKREFEYDEFIEKLGSDFDLSNIKKVSKKLINENILIVSVKTPKLPNSLKLIDIKTFEKFPYKYTKSNFSIEFFIYAFDNYDNNDIINKIKGL